VRIVSLRATVDSAQKAETNPAYKGRVKYTPEKARAYQVRAEAKERSELRLVERAFNVIPPGRVLDAPCGGGRVTLLLAERGYEMTAADLSDSMIEITREKIAAAGLKVPVEKQDVERLTYADRHFDTIISFRLFHHFPDAGIRQRVVRELCRVARENVALSYFSPYSFTSMKRKIRAARGGRKSQKHSTPLSEVRGYFENCGFELVKDFARLNLVHTLHLAVFRRKA
jgi:2-polyprenyl-3-methyl-5-hydroxy-6-metoxy-1,4-benzoquinol methylase